MKIGLEVTAPTPKMYLQQNKMFPVLEPKAAATILNMTTKGL